MNAGSESDPTTSSDLLARAKAGDREALDALMRLYLPRLRRWARGRLPAGRRGMLETEDIVQDTIRKAILHFERLDLEAEGALRAYLHRALTNQFITLYRDEHRRPIEEGLPDDSAQAPPAKSPSPLESAIGEEALARYEAALNALPEDDRKAIVLRIELCRGYDEIAAVLQKNGASQARVLVSRALDKLAREMRHGRR
jgi:RNA polymerase sigma factor (sigma-70 family)